MPRPGRRDALGYRLLGVPAAWFDHPERAFPALLAREDGAILMRVAASAGTLGLLLDEDGAPRPALRAALAHEPSLVTVCVGVNDAVGGMAARAARPEVVRLGALLWRARPARPLLRRAVDDGVRAEVVARIEDRLTRLLTAVAAPGRTVVALTYPVGDGSDATRDVLLGPLNDAIRRAAAAAGARVADLEAAFAGHDHRAPRERRWISALDGIHPTPRGHREVARVVAEAAR